MAAAWGRGFRIGGVAAAWGGASGEGAWPRSEAGVCQSLKQLVAAWRGAQNVYGASSRQTMLGGCVD